VIFYLLVIGGIVALLIHTVREGRRRDRATNDEAHDGDGGDKAGS
jgi:hypothetical protein